METKIRKGTLLDAIESVSTLDIIDAFDIPNKTRRGRTYLLCPGHDDRHFGSCYVDKNDNGYYCYVCGEHVTKWNMVLRLNGGRKADTRTWFFKMAGLTPIEENYDDPYAKAIRLIRQLEPYLQNNTVYNDLSACDKIDSSYGRNINGEYLYSEISTSNPLLDIYKADKQMFKSFVSNMLELEIKKTTSVKEFYEAHPDDCVYINGAGLIPYGELVASCQSIINNLQNLVSATKQL